jgi:hypothetical protein
MSGPQLAGPDYRFRFAGWARILPRRTAAGRASRDEQQGGGLARVRLQLPVGVRERQLGRVQHRSEQDRSIRDEREPLGENSKSADTVRKRANLESRRFAEMRHLVR